MLYLDQTLCQFGRSGGRAIYALPPFPPTFTMARKPQPGWAICKEYVSLDLLFPCNVYRLTLRLSFSDKWTSFVLAMLYGGVSFTGNPCR